MQRNTNWRADAACAGLDPEIWFPDHVTVEGVERTAEAKQVCATCPVCTDCLEYALAAHEPYGIWGGMTKQERRNFARRRRRRYAAA